MQRAEPIDPVELMAYADDQLDTRRRMAVEHWLSQNPLEAAQVLADLRLRSELRIVLAAEHAQPSTETEDLARRLNGRLHRQRLFRRIRPLLAASVLLSLGWIAHEQAGHSVAWASSAVPAYVAAAVEAHQTTELRASMHSQVQGTEYDPAELLARTQLKLPPLPQGWTITDVQVYPSGYGPSVEIAVATAEFGPVSLFAARPGQFLIMPPRTRHVEDTTTAYWQLGDVAYALVSTGHQNDVGRAATVLFETLR